MHLKISYKVSLKLPFSLCLARVFTLDGGNDDEAKIEQLSSLFDAEPGLSPLRPKKDKADEKMKFLQDEVEFLRSHSKTMQAELTEASTNLLKA